MNSKSELPSKGNAAFQNKKKVASHRDENTILSENNLKPENKNYKPIKIDEENELQIWGIVTYVIKSL